MLRTRVAAVIVMAAALAVVSPRPASAESDILSWLEELSGPGPFHARLPALQGGVRLLCGSKSVGGVHAYLSKYGNDPNAGRPCLENTKDIKWSLYVNYGYNTTGDANQFGEPTARAVRAHTVDVYARMRVHPAVDLGMGIGATYFTDGTDTGKFNMISNFTYTPVSLVVRPAQLLWDTRLARAFAVEFDQAVRFGSLSSTDFGGAAGAYSAHTELSSRTRVMFDVGVFFAKK